MIKSITVYECEDGKRFDNIEDAENYEKIVKECAIINMSLGVGNKPLYQERAIKHPAAMVDFCYERFIDLCRNVFQGYSEYLKDNDFQNIDKCFIHRVISDYGEEYPCISNLSYRFHRISTSTYIEYDQPYFTNNESEFKGKVI